MAMCILLKKKIFVQLYKMLHKLQPTENRSCNEVSVKNLHNIRGAHSFYKVNVSLHRNLAIQGYPGSSKLCILKRRVHLVLP